MDLTDDTSPGAVDVHRISPLDIHNKEFTKSFRGYNESEVDEFLDLLVAEFERLIRAYEEARVEMSGLQSRLEHYRGLEETLKNAIVLAQKTAEEIRESSLREADAIKREALLEAERTRDRATEAQRVAYEEIEGRRQTLLRFRAEFKAFLQSATEMADSATLGILERLNEGR